MHSLHKFLTILLVLKLSLARPGWESSDSNGSNYNPEERDYNYDENGAGVYDKIDEIVYPFQQYVQVRREYSVEHLPIQESESSGPQKADSSSKSRNPDTSASTSDHRHQHHEDEDNDNGKSYSNNDKEEDHGEDDDAQSHSHSYEKPRLTEEIEDYKKQEVYEEKGYSAGGYDHAAYASKSAQNQDQGDHHHPPESEQDEPSISNSRPHKVSLRYQQGKPRFYLKPSQRRREPHLSELPTSTKLLAYAASNLYDKEAHEKGIYAARDNIYCPEVTDFDLSSKKSGMGKGGKNPPGSKPRLRGLGDKIKCLKEKYWGKEPLPKEIFMEPSESRQAAIQIPTFDQFYSSFKDEISSMSDFQF